MTGQMSLQMQLCSKLLSNQECILMAVQNVDGADNIVKSQQAAAECERNASLCAEGVTRVQSRSRSTNCGRAQGDEGRDDRVEDAAC